MAYLDTSVLTAYYCPEQLSDAVGRVLRDISTPTISSLVEVELVPQNAKPTCTVATSAFW